MERYKKLGKLGEGSNGEVYKAIDNDTGKLVVLKKTPLGIDQQGIPSDTLQEISLLQRLSQSMYIVGLLSFEYIGKNSSTRPVLLLVFEYLETDLNKYIRSHLIAETSALTPTRIKRFLYQICKGVSHCHDHDFLHRDLKPHNLLLDEQRGILKIAADLGFGHPFNIPLKSYSHDIANLNYRAPEILLGYTPYSTAVDLWSVGCIFGVL